MAGLSATLRRKFKKRWFLYSWPEEEIFLSESGSGEGYTTRARTEGDQGFFVMFTVVGIGLEEMVHSQKDVALQGMPCCVRLL